MDKRFLYVLGAAVAFAISADAQRVTDELGRGLVAMKTDRGVFCSWRINANEWDGTEYNIYRGSTKLNEIPLKVSNFTDTSGSLDASYTVRPIINGVEGDACTPVKVWEKNYTIIKPQHDPEIKADLIPNDATVADVDGDGELEIIIKYDNQSA
ncbi:MAG: rhamnogalacturonan lyase, partial [Muribaculaceae bacterium]|nr:rhamnogalacturonan lyase [Muribaculaceae bacterium]